MIHRAKGDEVALYRFFDGDGCLLYVGISKDPLVRWQEHTNSHKWWGSVVEYEVVWHATRAAARAAEASAIRDEAPIHNLRGSKRPKKSE
ncbi:hypothetical protein BJP40_19930 [Streptomyces sp. CC53]|uniref:GIY-YIG nuclease family protein n=1 Tax=Streptomyces sp. CC53 TaxID=1906740 RepID=UPI0008DD5521|nr:GIY-YIG nuclease family protein [Streptomyces sp. CC53]OII64610.1 hypothetical protein BJP40_19930 [Streptomyces sp. CC53]